MWHMSTKIKLQKFSFFWGKEIKDKNIFFTDESTGKTKVLPERLHESIYLC